VEVRKAGPTRTEKLYEAMDGVDEEPEERHAG